MKLVRMPRELLTVEAADLPSLGVPDDLTCAAAELASRDGLTLPSAVVLGPREAGTTAVLMLVARKVGAAFRDRNIRLRDGGDTTTRRLRLCYLPGAILPEALASDEDRRALESEAAVFLQDLDDARRSGDDGAVDDSADVERAVLDLLRARNGAALQSFVSADPARLPLGILSELVDGRYVVLGADGADGG